MKILKPKFWFLFLVFFITFHVILGEKNFFDRSNLDIFPLGLNPSITHDSFSTRNPGIEDPFGILIDLPGGYSFYLSPILVTIPLLSDNLINNFPLPRLIGVIDPSNMYLTQLELQQLFFICVSGVLLTISGILFIGYYIKKRRNGNQ
jgi:hypothetical protein